MTDSNIIESRNKQSKKQMDEINYKIALDIFDEVNQFNDINKLIDLNCQSIEDAKMIISKRVYDIAEFLREKRKKGNSKESN